MCVSLVSPDPKRLILKKISYLTSTTSRVATNPKSLANKKVIEVLGRLKLDDGVPNVGLLLRKEHDQLGLVEYSHVS